MLNTHPVESREANNIWNVLVERMDAREEERESFLQAQERGCTEYRFGGNLGFGGKFWNNAGRWYVNCYAEDRVLMSQEEVSNMVKVNGEIQRIQDTYLEVKESDVPTKKL